MNNDNAKESLAALTRTAMHIKTAVESQDSSLFKRLFSAQAQINIKGRFYSQNTFFELVDSFIEKTERPSMAFYRIEEINFQNPEAFATYAISLSWVDAEAWEERSMTGLLSLTLNKKKERLLFNKKANWLIEGFSLTEIPVTKEEKSETGLSPGELSSTTFDLAQQGSETSEDFYNFLV
jgi:hypothetical protein